MSDTQFGQEEVERVARAICEASQGWWRTNDGMSEQAIAILDQDKLNNHWRNKARAAIAAMNPKPAEAASTVTEVGECPSPNGCGYCAEHGCPRADATEEPSA